jgi:glycosyltransferase involved in cell wall biosynthesis
MRIAMMVRGYIAAPGPSDIVYAPIDLAIQLSEGLEKLGHRVDFYGPAGTRLDVPVHTRGIRALVHNYSEFQKLLNSLDLLSHYIPGLWDQYLSSEMFRLASKGKYDILHFHHPEAAMPYARLYPKVPIIYTIHDPITGWWQELFQMYHTQNQFYVSISNSQRRPAPELPYIGNIYNGIDLGQFTFSKKHQDYLLFVGRIVPEKGADKAIELAKKTKQKLIIIGPTYADNLYYFETKIKPHLNKQIQYLGFLEHNDIIKYFQGAKAFIMPVQWEEPFGLTMIESMACGTPVIAFRRGSIPEVITHGKTGFVVDTMQEMIDAVNKIDKIDRKNCRDHVAKNFSTQIMVKGYETAYKNVIKITKRDNFPTSRLMRRYHRFGNLKPNNLL